MAKKQKRHGNGTVDDLESLACSTSLPDGALDDELWDACQEDARLAHEDVRGKVLLDQLTFLWEHGYDAGRLKEIMEEVKKQ